MTLRDFRNALGKERVDRTLRKVKEIRVWRGMKMFPFSGGDERQDKFETDEISSRRLSSISWSSL